MRLKGRIVGISRNENLISRRFLFGDSNYSHFVSSNVDTKKRVGTRVEVLSFLFDFKLIEGEEREEKLD